MRSISAQPVCTDCVYAVTIDEFTKLNRVWAADAKLWCSKYDEFIYSRIRPACWGFGSDVMNNADTEYCKNCIYFMDIKYNHHDGYCRRNAPSAAVHNGQIMTVMPATDHNDWCGEWKGFKRR